MLIGRADAAVTIQYSKAWPAAPDLRLLQVPGAGYDGIEIAAIPPGVTLCNVFEHEPGVSEYALLAMLDRIAHPKAPAAQCASNNSLITGAIERDRRRRIAPPAVEVPLRAPKVTE